MAGRTTGHQGRLGIASEREDKTVFFKGDKCESFPSSLASRMRAVASLAVSFKRHVSSGHRHSVTELGPSKTQNSPRSAVHRIIWHRLQVSQADQK
jgi:hypothetical protein